MGPYYPKKVSEADVRSLESSGSFPSELEVPSATLERYTPVYLVLGDANHESGTPVVKWSLNRREDVLAISINDLELSKLRPVDAVRILADRADYVVIVDSGDSTGHLVELGQLLTNSLIFEKCIVLQKESTEEREQSSMKRALFELIEEAGRLHTWTNEEDLVDIVDELPATRNYGYRL